MSELAFFNAVVAGMLLLALVIMPVLFFIPAPYGRHMKRTRFSLPAKWGWAIMEAPAVVAFAATYLLGSARSGLVASVFLVMWMTHYVQRAFVYPFLQTGNRKRISVQIIGMALVFNAMNGYLNGRYLFEFSGGFPGDWLADWRFLLGGGLFALGYATNRRADKILRDLGEASDGCYEIPTGGLFEKVSCPNYLGEMVIWTGWAIATWSLAGLTFAVWTIANLAPRAWAHHLWYRDHFAEYPQERRALLPGIW